MARSGQDKKRKYLDAISNHQGSALITAMVIGVIVMVFSLMLLLATYSLFASVNKRANEIKCRELAQSTADEIMKELVDVDYDDSSKEEQALLAGKDSLWFYVRYNLWQDSWGYYDAKEASTGHGMNSASKYFSVDFPSDVEETTLRMYWEKADATLYAKDGTILHILVTTKSGDSTYTTTRNLELQVNEYLDVTDTTIKTSCTDPSINGAGNEILKSEKWSWNSYD